MKNTIILLGILFGSCHLAHADSTQETAKNPPSVTHQKPIPVNDSDKVGVGSGDDMDTADEADPANDKDPEADEGTSN